MADEPKKPKKPILPTLTRLAADSLVETIDGPVEIVKLVGKVMPVLTRFEDGKLGFRMMTQIRELDPEADLLRLTNGDGQVLRVGADHVFVRADGREVRARELAPGDELSVLVDEVRDFPVEVALLRVTEGRARVSMARVVRKECPLKTVMKVQVKQASTQ